MRKIIHIFLSLVIVYASTTSAYANTSVGGWTALDTITAGATNTINATKTAGGKVLKSAVAVAPSAVKVGKHLIKGGGAAALLFAVPQILGEGVDWVLDPANNAIKYTVPINPDASTAKYLWPSGGLNFATANLACANELKLFKDAFSSYSKSTVTTNVMSERFAKCVIHKYSNSGSYAGDNTYQIGAIVNPAYNPDAPTTEEKYLPIADVAAQVISNAEAGHDPSQEAVKATALEGFAAGEHDAALEAAATEAGTQNPPDTENPPKDPDAPAEPFDPAGIISAINALKALLAGILSSITGLADIFNSDPPPEKTQKETDVPVDDLPPTKGASDFDVNYINFGGQCPVLPSFNVGIGGASSALTFDMTPLCDMAVKIRPAVIAIAYFIGLGVIASAIRET